MKTIGIKLADGTFYPVLEEGTPKKRTLDLTTAKDNQTKVQIDLYRSETGSMDDAQYVDTLEVNKLVPHPNGEPELHLSLGLDENNNLTAEVIDPETGKKSETEVNLVSKTLAEKTNLSEFAPSIKSASNLEPKETNEIADNSQPEDFSFDDLADDTLAEEEEKNEEPSDFPDPIQDDPTNLDPASENSALTDDDLPEIKSDVLEDLPFSFDNSEVFQAESSKNPETSVQSAPVDELGIADNTLEGMNFDKSGSKDDENPADNSSSQDSDDATVADTATDDFDLPDFDDGEFGSETSVNPQNVPDSDSNDATSKGATGIDFGDLPDFDDNEFSSDKKSSPSDTDIDNAFDTSALDDFDTSDLDASLDNLGISDSADSKNDKPGYTKGSAMDFSNLYDKETMNGEHATIYDENEDEKKKTKVPVIICIICAIICVIATILILFVVPSKYNLIKSRNTRDFEKKTVTEKTSESSSEKFESAKPVEESPIQIVETPAKTDSDAIPPKEENVPADSGSSNSENSTSESQKPVDENTAPAAEENKIVIAPEPEKVVPAPAPKAEKKPDVKHHIRWGDTLWDLSESYYRTPWKYPKIANYNHIKNPDLIISGTDILIPAE